MIGMACCRSCAQADGDCAGSVLGMIGMGERDGALLGDLSLDVSGSVSAGGDASGSVDTSGGSSGSSYSGYTTGDSFGGDSSAIPVGGSWIQRNAPKAYIPTNYVGPSGLAPQVVNWKGWNAWMQQGGSLPTVVGGGSAVTTPAGQIVGSALQAGSKDLLYIGGALAVAVALLFL